MTSVDRFDPGNSDGRYLDQFLAESLRVGLGNGLIDLLREDVVPSSLAIVEALFAETASPVGEVFTPRAASAVRVVLLAPPEFLPDAFEPNLGKHLRGLGV
jgi:hypothetical protein